MIDNKEIKVLNNNDVYRNKSLVFDKSDTLRSMSEGVSIINELVTSTLGPYGRNMTVLATNDKHGLPLVTNDGVRVIDYALLALDHSQLAGARIVHTASAKTDEVVGDGTTSTFVLASSIIKRFTDLVGEFEGSHVTLNKVKLRRNIRKVTDHLVKEVLPEYMISDVGENELSAVATVSSGDPRVGELIGGLRSALGPEGLINIRESLSLDDQAIYTPGYEFSGGFTHKGIFFGDDKLQRFDDALVMIIAKPLQVKDDATTIVNYYHSQRLEGPLFVITPSCQGQALEILARNFSGRSDGMKFPIFPIDLPVTTDYRGTLADLAAITGGDIISSSSDHSKLDLSRVEVPVGSVLTINTHSTLTQLIAHPGHGSEERIESQVTQIKDELESLKTTNDESRKADLQVRLSKLSGNSCTLALGGATSVERNERRMRYSDAILATHSAQKSGVVIGAGMTYLKLSEYLKGMTTMYSDPVKEIISGNTKDEVYLELSQSILAKALESISYNVIANSGVELSGSEFKKLVVSLSDNPYAGIDLDSGALDLDKYSDLSVLDPYELVEAVIQNATSAAESFISTDNLVLISQ